MVIETDKLKKKYIWSKYEDMPCIPEVLLVFCLFFKMLSSPFLKSVLTYYSQWGMAVLATGLNPTTHTYRPQLFQEYSYYHLICNKFQGENMDRLLWIIKKFTKNVNLIFLKYSEKEEKKNCKYFRSFLFSISY